MIKTTKYNDIINMPRHISKKYKQMSIAERSAQFAPFAALTGYEDEINETARIVDRKIELDEYEREIIDAKIKIIKENIKNKPLIVVTYFVEDLVKQGGSYVCVKDNIKKIDEYNKILVLNKSIIKIDNIISIDSDIFLNYYR